MCLAYSTHGQIRIEYEILAGIAVANKTTYDDQGIECTLRMTWVLGFKERV
jgi:hypothetical protein